MSSIPSIRKLIVEVFELTKPLTAYDYSHEAITTVGGEQHFFYGYSTEEVLSKVLTHCLNRPSSINHTQRHQRRSP